MKCIRILTAAMIVAALTLGMFWAPEISAQVPKPNVYDGGNRWLITGFIDQTPDHQEVATQVICFGPYVNYGTGITGVWYSLSFPDWNGIYYQEGDEVKMTGDYAKDVGHDHMTLFHTTYDHPQKPRGMAFKDWTEWREDGAFGRIIGFANARMTRSGRCPHPKGVGAAMEKRVLELSLKIPPRLMKDSKEEAKNPGDHGQESLETYFKRTGQNREK